jgi:uncharacterized protein (DUF1697 family)
MTKQRTASPSTAKRSFLNETRMRFQRKWPRWAASSQVMGQVVRKAPPSAACREATEFICCPPLRIEIVSLVSNCRSADGEPDWQLDFEGILAHRSCQNQGTDALHGTLHETILFDPRWSASTHCGRTTTFQKDRPGRYTDAAMSVMVCLLRGVNLGAHKRLKMEDLRAMCESMKLREAQTYVQSGNLIFKTDEKDLRKLAKKIEAAIEKKYGFQSDVILRTVAELKSALERNPFAKRRGMEPKRLLITFLAGEPATEAGKKVQAMKTEPEEVSIDGREMYIYFPNGMARPTVPWTTLERTLGVRGTGRNLNSVRKMLEMAEQMEAQ